MNRREIMAALGAWGLSALLAPGAPAAALKVPYYSSRSDLENGLAAARMVLGAFEPPEHWPVADVTQMISHRPGFWVFEAQLAPILLQKGYDVTIHALTPYAELIAGGAADRYGEGAAARIDRPALAWARPYLTEGVLRQERVTLDQALAWQGQGEVVMISVDRAVLRSDPSLPYLRYYLILTGEERDLVFHDPGAGPLRRAPRDLIERAFTTERTDRAVLRVRSSGA